jgi:hypothetical protein
MSYMKNTSAALIKTTTGLTEDPNMPAAAAVKVAELADAEAEAADVVV